MMFLNEDSLKYSRIHTWIRKNFGKADHCSNEKCNTGSKDFQWAKIKDKSYDFNIEHFIQLCRRCHIEYDYSEKLKKKPAAKNNINRFPAKGCLMSAPKVVKLIRNCLRETQSQLGYRLKLSKVAIYKWEKGKSFPTPKHVKMLLTIAKANNIKIKAEDFYSD